MTEHMFNVGDIVQRRTGAVGKVVMIRKGFWGDDLISIKYKNGRIYEVNHWELNIVEHLQLTEQQVLGSVYNDL